MPNENNQPQSAEGAKAHQFEQDFKGNQQTVGEALTQERQKTQERTEKLSKEQADRLYEERIEEEYAKREGGA